MSCGVFSAPNRKSQTALACVLLLSAVALSGCSIPRFISLKENGQRALKEGKPDAARKLLESAIQEARREGHPEKVADAYKDLALLSVNDFQKEKSKQLALRGLELAERQHGLEDKELLPYLLALGQVAYRQHDFEAAQSYYSRALKLHDQGGWPDDMQTGELLGGLISATCVQGKCIDADPLYTRLIKVRTRYLGADHQHTLSAQMMYAESLERKEQYDKAREIYMDCIRRAQTKSQHLLPTLLTCVGRLYNRKGRYIEAEQALKAAERLDRTNPLTLARYQMQRELAIALEGLSRFDEARRHYESAISAAQKSVGANAPETLALQDAYRKFKARR